MSKALKSRLARLEQRTVHRPPPRIVFHVHGRTDGELRGFQTSEGVVVMRMPGEALSALKGRAWSLTSGLALTALYAPLAAPETGPAEPIAAPATEPWPAEPVPGIGRVASRAELIKAGAIPVPPERLI